MEPQNILITGATGSFGKYLFRCLARSNVKITVLVRANDNTQAIKRMSEITGLSHTKNIKVLKADLTSHNLGLDKTDYSEICKSTSTILHAAASTKFNLSQQEAYIANITTTKNILEFAGNVNNLTKFGYVSTAFVAGKMTGRIPETKLKGDFVNTYDQSKYMAEQLVRSKSTGVPTVIYRPSLVVADDSDNHHAAIAVLNLIKNNLLLVIPGQPEDLVDLISATDASNAICELFSNHFVPGKTYHIASGETAPSLSTIIGVVEKQANKVKYSGHDPRVYDEMVKNLITNIPEVQPVYEKIDSFIKYLCYPKVFETRNTINALKKSIITDDILGILTKRLSNA